MKPCVCISHREGASGWWEWVGALQLYWVTGGKFNFAIFVSIIFWWVPFYCKIYRDTKKTSDFKKVHKNDEYHWHLFNILLWNFPTPKNKFTNFTTFHGNCILNSQHFYWLWNPQNALQGKITASGNPDMFSQSSNYSDQATCDDSWQILDFQLFGWHFELNAAEKWKYWRKPARKFGKRMNEKSQQFQRFQPSVFIKILRAFENSFTTKIFGQSWIWSSSSSNIRQNMTKLNFQSMCRLGWA